MLKTGVPANAPCCDKHSQIDRVELNAKLGRVLQNRTLMPMCVKCANMRQQELALDFEVEYRGPIDSCCCAAFVFDNHICQWCALEELDVQRGAYERKIVQMLPYYDISSVPYLMCGCGDIPMGTPRDASPAAPLTREVLRYCPGCNGVVNVPLHHIDGRTHLACIPGRPSTALLDEDGLVAMNVQAELLGIGDDETCEAHPVCCAKYGRDRVCL